jgi:diguanylate cyclase (GGDEF)-like protein
MNLDALSCDCPDCPAGILARHLLEENARLRNLAGADELTGLLNRRGMRATWSTWCRAGGDLIRATVAGVAMLDLDLFKPVNDKHGHEAGDRVLRRLADLIRRTGGTGVRLGGDEFAVFLSNAHGAYDPFDALRTLAAAVAEPIAVTSRDKVEVTLSIGAVGIDEVDQDDDPETWLGHLLRTADMRLYMAKDAGRARIVGPGR